MARSRRVGTFTLGCVLLIMGVLLILRMFVPVINYVFIFHLWPLVPIMLGIEILLSLLWKGESEFKYDFAAIIILFALVGFSMCMAFADLVITSEAVGNYLGTNI